MARSRSKSPPPPRRPEEPEVDVDPTERFQREEQGSAPMILSVPPEADTADLALTQPLPRVSGDEFDEDLIRTHEMPRANDDWLEEMLESGERSKTRARMPSRPGKETTGLFPHPAARGAVTRRSPSQAGISPAPVPAPNGDVERRIRAAYRQYFKLCQKHAQAVVGEESFAERLRQRLAKLAEKYPREQITFRAVVDDGVVRVRVLLAKSKR